MTTLYRAPCPLSPCSWKSEPAESEAAAREERRGHISGHTHSDLVVWIVSGLNGIERYEQAEHSEP